MTIRRVTNYSLSIVVLVFLASAASAQVGSRVANWTVPAYSGSSSGAREMKTLGDHGSPVLFEGFDPCRIVDTRGNGFTGAYGPPALTGGVPRNFNIMGGPCAGIASGAVAYSFNITVTNTQGPGFILIYPQGGSQPNVSTVNYVGGQTIANAAIVPAGSAGGVTVVAGVSGTDILIDINGYFAADPINNGEPVSLVGSHPFALLYSRNQNSAGYSIWGDCQSGCIGVYGTTAASGQTRAGVWGWSTNAIGTYGGSVNYNGLWGASTSWDALAAFGGRDGGYLQGARNGLFGVSTGTTGVLYGVIGETSSPTDTAAGVIGIGASGASLGFQGSSGVIGTSKTGIGLAGSSQLVGVVGDVYTNAGSFLAEGNLARTFGANFYGEYSFGDTGATGTKFFVEPHPTDASKIIRYVALEGPESGTYFRGSAKTVHGQAVIDVPESFRMVTDTEGLTVQVTPMGDLATMAVGSKDLNRIVVMSSKDVAFDYLVHGVRRAFKNFQPVSEGGEFMPMSLQESMPAYLTEEAKSRLISNGTYNQDGTVNTTTAERLGWTKIWADREAEAAAGAKKASAARAQDRQKQ